MAQIGYIIICDEVFENQNRGFTINNPYVQLTPYSIPGEFSFSLSFSIFDIKPTEQYRILVHLKSPKEIIWEADINITAKDEAKNVSHTLMNVPFKNLLLTEEGLYKAIIEVLWDDKKTSKELIFPVRKRDGDLNG